MGRSDWKTVRWEEGPWALAGESAGEGAPTLFLHGFGLTRDSLRPLAEAALARGTCERALLLDWPGHGESGDLPPDLRADYPTLRSVLLRFLEAVAPEGAHLVGHSMGGQIGWMAARTRPGLIRSLAMLGAGACRAVEQEEEKQAWEGAAKRFEGATPEQLVRALHRAGPLTAEPPGGETPERLFAGARGPQLARYVREGFLRVEHDLAAGPALGVPLLVLWGEQDETWAAASRALVEAIPGARGVALAGGHLLHIEAPEAVADVLAERRGEIHPRTRDGGWRRLGSERLHANPWYAIRRDLLSLPGGEPARYHVVEHPGWVMIVPRLEDGRVLLERVYRWPLQDWQIECPSGGRDGESPERAGARELLEETGYTATRWQPLGRFSASSGVADERFDVFLATGLRETRAPQREATEQMELLTLPWKEACAMARRGEIADAPSALSLLLADAAVR